MLEAQERMLDPDIQTCIEKVGWTRRTVIFEYNRKYNDDKLDADNIRAVISYKRAMAKNLNGELTNKRRERVREILAERSQDIRTMNCY